MPQPIDPNKYPKFYWKLAEQLGKTDKKVTFQLSNKKEVLELKARIWAFRRSLEKELGKLPKNELETRFYLEKLNKNLCSFMVKGNLEDYQVSLVPRETDPLNVKVEEQLNLMFSLKEDEEEIDLTGEKSSEFSGALDRFKDD